MPTRSQMVSQQLASRGIHDPAVLEAMGVVPREAFVDEKYFDYAYDDGPLPTLEGQTISQPYVVALMTEALNLQAHHKALEVGTGTGYAAAILGQIASEVHSVERLESLVLLARQNLAALNYNNVHVHNGDGTLGWPQHAPYDAIVVAAGGPTVPQKLKEQLRIGGRLVMPVGRERRAQQLIRVTRTSETEYNQDNLSHVRFVPLIGEQGWDKDNDKWLGIF